MRTETEMMSLIIDTAKSDERIRAVILNGSRADEYVTKDIYSDYDIIYMVNDFQYFVDKRTSIMPLQIIEI